MTSAAAPEVYRRAALDRKRHEVIALQFILDGWCFTSKVEARFAHKQQLRVIRDLALSGEEDARRILHRSILR